MTNLILFVCVFLLFSCQKGEQQKPYNQGINIIPTPKNIELTEGGFEITPDTYIFVADESKERFVGILSDKIECASGLRLNRTEDKSQENIIIIDIDSTIVNKEGYSISIDNRTVRVSASTDAGLFYGTQTLLQLFDAEIESKAEYNNKISLPALKIEDHPTLSYRGLLIDVSRHFFSVEQINKQIEIMGMLKLNKLHLHLTDNQGWRIEIKKYPELVEYSSISQTYNGKKYGSYFYTQEDIKSIIRYADLHNIEVIPEIEFPGHSLSALVPFPNLSCSNAGFVSEQVFGFEENVFCAGNEDVYGFMEDVLSEVAELFPSQYIHIGGDECSKRYWSVCPKCQSVIKREGLRNDKNSSAEEKLQSYAIERVHKFIKNQLNKTMIGWHEVLEGGIDEDVTIMSWRNPEIGERAAQRGHNVIMAPMPKGFYLCDYQGALEVEPAASGEFGYLNDMYNYNPVSDSISEKGKNHIIGIEACMWSEWLCYDGAIDYMLYPRLVALSEVGWSEQKQKNWIDFCRRLDNFQVRLKYNDINFHIPMPEGVLTQNVVFEGDSTILELANSRHYPMVYTVDGSEPTPESETLPAKLVLKKSCTLKVATLVPGDILSPARIISIEKQTPRKSLNVDFTSNIRLQIAEGLFISDSDYHRAQFHTDTIIKSLSDYNKSMYDFRKPSLAVYSGYINIPETKIYTFESNSDELWIADRRLIYNPNSSRFNAQKSQLLLEKGVHNFKLVFSNRLKDGFASSWYEIGFNQY